MPMIINFQGISIVHRRTLKQMKALDGLSEWPLDFIQCFYYKFRSQHFEHLGSIFDA